MPRNLSGVYTLPAGNPVVPGTTIDAAWANSTLEDMANEITNSLSRTGAGGMLAPFRIADGNVTAPGLAFLNETNSGLFRISASTIGLSVSGVLVAQATPSALLIPTGKQLQAQGGAAVTGTLSATGAVTFSSTLAVTGAITATAGVVGNVTGNVTAASGTSTFHDVVINNTLEMTSGVISGLASPANDTDAANKAYVDSVAQGLDIKASVRAATTANIALSGAQTIDGVAIVAGNRVLVKNQTAAADNGIYVAAAGAWSRSADANTWDELVSAFVFVEDGTTNDNSGWVCSIAPGGTLGVTAVTFEQFSGAGQITAGAGLTKTGNTLNVGTASASRIVVGTDDIDLATTGITPGTYKSLTIDAYGRATGGTNPTTLAGYGITDAYTSSYIDTLFGSTASAAASAAAAASSASAASGSASSASTSASNALSYLNTFRGQYIGASATDPTVDGNGNALTAGDLYFNTVANETRVYTGSTWLAAYVPSNSYLPIIGGSLTGNLNFSGSGLRITGDMSNATQGNNLAFQTSTTNGNTTLRILPNGTGNAVALTLATDSTQAGGSTLSLFCGTGLGESRITSGINGSGTYLPLTFYVNAAEQMRLSSTTLTLTNNPTLSAGTANGVAYLNGSKVLTTGSALTYNGSRLKVTGDLYVNSDSNYLLMLNAADSTWWGRISQSGSDIEFYNRQSGALKFGINDSEQMRLTSSGLEVKQSQLIGYSSYAGIGTNGLAVAGNVGIGMSSPAYKLDVAGATRIVETGTPSGAAALQISVNGVNARTIRMTDTAPSGRVYDFINRAQGIAGNLGLFDDTAGAYRWILDASGNWGLGVTPSAWRTGSGERALQVGSRAALFCDSGLTTDVLNNVFVNTSSQFIYINSAAASRYQQNGGAHNWYTAPSGTAGNAISFTQAMTLSDNGDLLVGTTASGGQNGFAVLKGAGGIETSIEIAHNFGTASGVKYVDFLYATGTIGSITQNGTTAVAYNTTSDYRLKDNQQPLTGSGAFIDALKPKTWSWKADGTKGVGFIAHEVQEVSPGSVVGEKDAVDSKGNPVYQAMEYGSAEFIANIIAELQSLRARVAQLEAK